MEEELQLLLDKAETDGYDDNQKLDVIKWYNTNRPVKNTAPSSEDYLFDKYKDVKPTTPNALQQFGTAAYSAVADQLPSGVYAAQGQFYNSSDDSDPAFLDYLSEQSGSPEIKAKLLERNQRPLKDIDQLKHIEEDKAYAKEKVGEATYNNFLKEYKTQNQDKGLELLSKSDTQDKEAAERTKGFTKELSDVNNAGDVVRYIAEGVGQGVGSTIPAIATLGMSSYLQESGPAYKEGLDEVVKAMSAATGDEWTREMVVKGGYDKKARDYAENVGLINAGLESVSDVVTLGLGSLFIKKGAKQLAKPAVKKILTAMGTGAITEFGTEYVQESNTQYAALKSAGHTDEEIFGKDGADGLFDWDRPLNAAVKGAAGGSVMGGGAASVSSVLDKKTESKTNTAITDNAKESLKVQAKTAKVEGELAAEEGATIAKTEKADEIIAQVENEDVNSGTEEEVVSFAESIKTLVQEKKRNEELQKIQKEEQKIEENKEKIVETAIKEKQKIDEKQAKEAEKNQVLEAKPNEETKQVIEEAPKAEITAPVQETKVESKEEIKTELEEKTTSKDLEEIVQPKLPVKPKKIVELTPEKKQEQVDTESNKFNNQFNNNMRLVKPSQKLERLLNVRKNIEGAKYKDQHNELYDRVDKEIAKLQIQKESKIEAKALKPIKEVPVVDEIKVAKQKELDTEIETLEEQKNTITSNYSEVRTKTGQVVRRATPIYGEKGEVMWNPKDLDDVRAINKRLDEIKAERKKSGRSPKQEEDYNAYRAEGLDDSVSNALVNPQDFNDLGVSDLGITDKRSESTLKESNKWGNLEEVPHGQYIADIKRMLPRYEASEDSKVRNSVTENVWDKALTQMFGVIRKASEGQGKTTRFFYGDNTADILGTAVRDDGNMFVFIKRGMSEERQRKDQTQLHEFIHLFEYAGHQLEVLQKGKGLTEKQKFDNESLVRTPVSRAMDKIHAKLINESLTKLKNVYKVLANDPNKEGQAFKNNFSKISSADQLLLLHLFKGELSRFSLSELKAIITQLENHQQAQRLQAQASRATTQDQYDAILSEYNKLNLSQPVYGFANGREMIAEGMSNPYFMGYLASTKSDAKSNVSFLESIYNALVEVLNHFSEILARNAAVLKYNIKLPTYSDIKKSYLNEILSTMEDNLKSMEEEVAENGEFGPYDLFGNAIANKVDDDYSADAKKTRSDKKINKEISDKIIKQAQRKNIETIKEFKALIAETEKELGIELGGSLKAGMTRRYNTFLKKLTIISNRATIFAAAEKSEKSDEVDFRLIIRDTKAIDPKTLSVKEKEKLAKAIEAIASEDNEQLYKAKSFVQNKAATRNVDEIVDPKTGMGFQEFTKILGTFKADKLVNLPTFINNISKYSQDKAAVLMKHLHDPIGTAHKNTTLQVNSIVSTMNEIALKNKLDKASFNKIYLHGQLLTDNPIKPKTLDEKYKDELFSLNTTKQAIEKKHNTEITVEEVNAEIQILKSIYDKLKLGDSEILTTGEQEYHNFIRETLDGLMPNIKANSEITWGTTFVTLDNYMPKVVIGAIPVAVKGDAIDTEGPKTKYKSMGESDLLDAMTQNQNYQVLSTAESGFHQVRTGGRGVYYDTNIHTVMSKYLHSTLFNLNAGYQVQVANKMLFDDNALKLTDELGVPNVKRVKTFLKNSIKTGRVSRNDFSVASKFLLNFKNTVQTAKIGTSGQFLTQYVSMLPATMALTGFGNTQKAMKFLWAARTDSDMKDNFQQLIAEYSSQLAVRDFFQDRYETVEDLAKEGTAGRLQRLGDKLTRNTVTKVTSSSDKYASQLTFLAAFLEAGADMNDKATWTQERIAKAELKMATLQNTSSTVFTAETLRQDTEKDALFNAAMMSFKTFALNATMNSISAIPEAVRGNKEAQKILKAHAASFVGYEMTNAAVKATYIAAAYGVARAFGYEPPEKKEDESILEFTKGIIINAFYNMFFGGTPSVADASLRYMINEGGLRYLSGGKSPLFSATSTKDVVAKAVGPFEEMISTGLGLIDIASQALPDGETKMTEAQMYDLYGKLLVETIRLGKIIPFRGDIAKIVQSGLGETKKRKFQNKKRRKKTTNEEYY